jgi:hypothetical protein
VREEPGVSAASGLHHAASNHQVQFAVARRPERVKKGVVRRPATYTGEEIIEAMKRWVSMHGEPPRTIDWEPTRARRLGHSWRADRFESGQWPTARMVAHHFSTFNTAVEAAGLTARPAPSRTRPNLSGSQAIIDALVEWTRRYGDIPTMADWDPARARRLGQDWRIARYHQGDWPSARSVATHFGSFANAAAAAGLIARARSTHHHRRQQQQATNRHAAARARPATRIPGHQDLAESVRALARARAADDPVAMHVALIDLAGAALAWAELFGSD